MTKLKYFLLIIVFYSLQSKASSPDSLNIKTNYSSLEYHNKSINKEHFNKGIILSPFELIQGKIPGLGISIFNLSAAGEISIQNQAHESLNKESIPLIVIDGIAQYNGSINLNISDIGSIKYVNSTSETGINTMLMSRGAIFIETIKPSDEFKVNYSFNVGISALPQYIDVMSAEEFSKKQTLDETYYKQYVGNSNTNWQEQISQKASHSSHYLSASGIFGKTKFRVSLGKLNKEGSIINTEYKQNTANLNLEHELFDKHLNIAVNLRALKSNNRIAYNNVVEESIKLNPTVPVNYDFNEENSFTYNSLEKLKGINNEIEKKIYSADIKLDYKLHFYPKISTSFVYSKKKNEYSQLEKINNTKFLYNFYNIERFNKETDNFYIENTNSRTEQENSNSFIELRMNYASELKSINSYIDLSVAYSENKFTYESKNLNIRRFGYDYMFFHFNEAKLYNKALLLNYTYDNKYALKLSVQKNSTDTEINSSAHSIMLSWDIKKEDFLKGNSLISELSMHISSSKTKILESLLNRLNFDNSPSDIRKNTDILGTKKEQIIKINYALKNSKIRGSFSYKKGKFIDAANKFYMRNPMPNSYNEIICRELLSDVDFSSMNMDLDFVALDTEEIKWMVNTNINIFKPIETEIKEYTGASLTYGSGNNETNLHKINAIDLSENKDNKIFLGLNSYFYYKDFSFSFSGRLNYNNKIYNKLTKEYYERLSCFRENTEYEANYDYEYTSKKSNYLVNASFFSMDNISASYRFNKLCKKDIKLNITASIQNAFTITKYQGLDPEMLYQTDNFAFPRTQTYSLKLGFEF